MWTKHISKLLEYCPNFLGVYPCDRIPDIKPFTSMIINTDVSSGPGEHWIAVYIGSKTMYFFDSFGRDIDDFSNPFRNYMKNFSRDYNVKVESRLLQSLFSNMCGYWCIFYIFCRTCRLDSFYKYFSDNLELNDEILKYFFEYFESFYFLV